MLLLWSATRDGDGQMPRFDGNGVGSYGMYMYLLFLDEKSTKKFFFSSSILAFSFCEIHFSSSDIVFSFEHSVQSVHQASS